MQTQTRNPATDKQIAFLSKLASERPAWAAEASVAYLLGVGNLSTREASAMIDSALKVRKEVVVAVETRTTPVGALALSSVEVGSYWTEAEGIARVRQSKSSDRLYAEVLRLIPAVEGDEWNDATPERAKFDYARGAIYHLARRMTVEEARAFGARHSICCVCGRNLKANKSVDEGIGPVCKSKI